MHVHNQASMSQFGQEYALDSQFQFQQELRISIRFSPEWLWMKLAGWALRSQRITGPVLIQRHEKTSKAADASREEQ